jgi:hypothetical protein
MKSMSSLTWARQASLMGLVGALLAAGCGGEDDPVPGVDGGAGMGGSGGMGGMGGMGGTPGNPNLTISPPTHQFQPVTVGETGTEEQVFTVTNTGDGAAGASAVVISGATADFAVGNNTCSSAVQPGASCAIAVKFAPKSAGSKVLTITAAAGAGNTIATLSGIGLSGATLSAMPTALDLGVGVIGTTGVPITVTVRNLGDRPSSEITATSTGANAADFAVTDGCAALDPGAACTVNVAFKPTGTMGGVRNGTLVITAQSGGTEQVSLTGTASTAAALSATPTSGMFADTLVNAQSASRSFMVSNTGGAPISNLTVQLTSTTDFTVDPASNCAGITLMPNATCTVAAVFAPKSAGAKQTSLTVSGGTANTTASISLSGTGITAPVLTTSAAEVNFGSIGVNKTSTQMITFTNSGGSATPILMTAIAGSAFFTQTTTCNAAVAPMGTCTVTVTYSPTAAGDHQATLTVSGGTVNATVALRGAAVVTNLSLSGASPYNFGSSGVGIVSGTTNTIAVTNAGMTSTGMLAVTIGGTNASDFAIGTSMMPCGAPLTPNATCTIPLTFTPGATGARTATLTITSATDAITVTLQGTGLALFEATPDTTFADTTVGTNGNDVTYTVTARTATTVATDLSGLGMHFSLITNECAGASLSPAADPTCDITVRFTPRGTPGAKTGTIVLTPGAAGLTPVTINLTGTAVGPIAFTVVPLAFGSAALNTATELNATLQNNGAIGVIPNSAPTIAGTDASQFSVVSQNCSGATLAPTGTCTIRVRFVPTTVGAKSATLSIMAPGGEVATVALTGTGAPASLTPSQMNVAFASTIVGNQSGITTVTLTNSGLPGQSFPSLAVSLTGANAAEFALPAGGTCQGATLANAGTCTINVRFNPALTTAAGDKVANIRVTQTVGMVTSEVLLVPLTGSALPALVVTPASGTLAIGDVIQNETTPNQPNRTPLITVTNQSASAFAVTRTVPAGFAVVAATDTCAGAVLTPLAAGASCAFQLTASAPMALGALAGNLTIAPTVAMGAPVGTTTLALTANVITDANINFVEVGATFPFGKVTRGVSTATAQTLTVRNDGASVSGPLMFVMAGDDSQFNGTGSTCVHGTTTLAPGATCTVTVNYAPTADATHSATLQVTESSGANGSDTGAAVTFTGTATSGAMPSLTPTPVTFGSASAGGTPVDRVVTFRAEAMTTVPLPTFVGGAGFSLVAFSSQVGECEPTVTMLTAGQTCNFFVRWTPMGAAGLKTDTLTVDLGGGVTAVAALQARVLDPAMFMYSGGANVGDVLVGATSAPITLTVTNTGQTTSQAITIAKAGADAGQFTVTDLCAGMTLAGGASCDVTVTLTPTGAVGARNATIEIVVGGANSGQIQAITGRAVTPAAIVTTPVSGGTVNGGTVVVSGEGGWQTVTVANTVAAPGQSTGALVITPAMDANFEWDLTGLVSGVGDPCVTGGAAVSLTEAGGADPSCTIAVRFTPQSLPTPPTFTTSVTITAPAGGSSTINVTGTAATTLSYTGTTALGSTPVNTATANQTLTITHDAAANDDTAAISLSFTGGDAGDFRIVGGTCTGFNTVLTPSDTCTVIVNAVPSTAGAKSTTLRVSGGSAGHTVDIPLTASGAM